MEPEVSEMTDKIIVTKRGTYERVQVTLPLPVKMSMMSWMRNSGMGKAEFFLVALMMGVARLADQKKPRDLTFFCGIMPHIWCRTSILSRIWG